MAMKEKIDTLTRTVDELEIKCSDLEDEVANLKKIKCSDLEDEVANLKNEIQELSQKNELLRDALDSIRYEANSALW